MSSIDVVISGIGGRFPNSRNIQEFSDKLLSGQSLLKIVDRWPAGSTIVPKLAGLTDGVEKFDYTTFGMHYELSRHADPQTRQALETAFEALVDAGINPTVIRGSNAHVYAGTLMFENDVFECETSTQKRSAYMIIGRNRSMNANRLSYCFNLSGRSCSYDASGGFIGAGLALAREAIQNEECDTAFVYASSVIVFPEISEQKQSMGLLSKDGTCRPFAVDASGAPRGEAQVMFLVQRADIAKRSYGSIVLAAAEPQHPLPNWFLSLNEETFKTFLTDLYRKNGLDPAKVKLLEADGLAVKNMVEAELNVLDQVLNEKRSVKSPLYVGTVKSVTGDTDASAGFTALTKLILAMETGFISPTLNCGTLNPNLRGLAEGRLKLVTEPTKWDVTPDTHVAVSSLTTSGLVSHVVLKANGKTKVTCETSDYKLPYLILMSGRSEDYVHYSLNMIAESTFDPEYLRLTQEVFAMGIDKFEFRGYGFHEEPDKFVIQRENRRPVWFVYSGMGSQWPQMGKDLLSVPIINETFQRLHKILEPKGVDLMNILTTVDSFIFDNILNSFVGIAAVQVALTNVLKQLGIVPDGLIGHSVGELGCSYGDGCLTEEQVILAAYERGMASLKADLIPGLMAAVGLGYKQVKNLLPPDVYVACHNSQESCTISGPAESVQKVIESFEKEGIFVRGVNVSNVAYHSPYIRPVAPILFESLRKVIPSPKLRSPKWICTSAPKEKWDTDEVRYCSAEYHTNNLLGSVLFEEGMAYIPPNALLIEIAPHGLLQAILKRSFSGDSASIALTRRNTQSSSKFLLEAIGKLFLEGLSPKIWHLYPDVEMPVSRNTPSLAPLIKWEHSQEFPLQKVEENTQRHVFSYELRNFSPSIEIAKSKCFPAAYALIQIYHSFSKFTDAEVNAQRVIMDNIRFYDVIKLDEKDLGEIHITILPITGSFSVERDNKTVIRGRIQAVDDNGYKSKKLPKVDGNVEGFLSSVDVYSELETLGVVVPDKMKNIQELYMGRYDWVAKIPYDDDFARLINSFIILFQLESAGVDKKPASISHIQELIIDPTLKDNGDTNARLHLATGTLIYPGFSMSGVELRSVEPPGGVEPVALRFVPFRQTGLKDEAHFLSTVLQLSSDRRWQESRVFKICDIDGELTSVTDKLHDLLQSKFEATALPKEADLIVCGLSSLNAMAPSLTRSNNLLLTRCSRNDRTLLEGRLRESGLDIIAESEAKESANPLIVISSLLPPIEPSDCQIIKMKPHEAFPANMRITKHRFTILVWECDTFLPIEEMLSDARFTTLSEKIRLVVLMTPDAPSFSMSLPLYADQLRLNVPINVYLDGKWGNYRLLPMPQPCQVVENGHRKVVIDPNTTLRCSNTNSITLDNASIKIYNIDDQKRQTQSSKETIGYSSKYSDGVSIIGVATWEEDSNKFVPDPILIWTARDECHSAAAPEIFSYAMAYYILFELPSAGMQKSMLITCPLTSLGKAIIRVGIALNCAIVVLVSSLQEKHQLRQLFPKLKATVIVSSSDSFTCTLKKEYPAGVHLIVSDLTGSRLRACTECAHGFGTIVQIGEDAKLSPDYIGMNFFLRAVAVYGVSHQTLLNASPKVKKQVQQLVEKALESGIFAGKIKESVPTINGSIENGARENGDYNKNNCSGMEYDTINTISKNDNRQKKSAIIIGGSKAQWVRLSYSLALEGCKLVGLVQQNHQSSPNLVTRHSKILQRQFNVELRDLTNVRSGADLLNSDLGNLRFIFVFGNNSFAEEVIRELDARKLKDVRILFFSKNSNCFTRECERLAERGLKVRAALGVEEEALSRATLNWLLSPSASNVIVFNPDAFVGVKATGTSLAESGLLPTSHVELQALGAAVRKLNSPVVRGIATRGLSAPQKSEVNPLFFIQGVHGSASSELKTLASDLLAPLAQVTLHANCGSLDATAAAVVQELLKVQKRGPFNLAGDTIRSDVVLKVARILDGKGHASVVFLMNEHIANLRDGLSTLQNLDRLGETILTTALADSIDHQTWSSLLFDNMEWSTQVQTAVSKIPSLRGEDKDDVVAALHHIYDSVHHILESREEAALDHGIVHLLKKGDSYREFKLTESCLEQTIPSTELKRKELGYFFSAHLGTPVLQLKCDRNLAR